jgi:hypothetical protein
MAWYDAVWAGTKSVLKDIGIDFDTSTSEGIRRVGNSESEGSGGLDDLYKRMRKQNGGDYCEDFELLIKMRGGDHDAYQKTKANLIRKAFSSYVDKYWIHGCGGYVQISKELLDDDAGLLTVRFNTSEEIGMLRYKCVRYGCVYEPKMVAIGGEAFLNCIVKKCDACLEFIPNAAKKCKHCHSDT